MACVAAIVLAGCSSGSGEGELPSPEGTATVPLGQCIAGWWEKSVGPCTCDTRPECELDDCERFLVRRFDGEGAFAEGYVVRSESAGTLSSTAAMMDGTYVITGSEITLNAMVSALPASCNDDLLTIGSFIDARSAASVAEAMESALANSNEWEAVSFR